jgi:hypothetical protein
MRSNSAKVIDDLGRIRARIAKLAAQESEIERSVIAMGKGEHEGSLFRATVLRFRRDFLDMEAARAKLGSQFVSRHTRSVPIVSVRVSAMKKRRAS